MKKTPHLEDEVHLYAWWRRGRVELPVQKTPRSKYTTGLADLNIRTAQPRPADAWAQLADYL